MKRTAAILGPTPQFVRWAIEQPCELRDLELDRLPETTFGQLRSIREASRGLLEGRVFEGICVHPSVDRQTPPNEVRAFPIGEIVDLVGGNERLNRCCGNCPANAAVDDEIGWAGCYGWLPADLDWQPAPTPPKSKANANEFANLERSLSRIIEQDLKLEYEREFDPSCHGWFGLWRRSPLNTQQLAVVRQTLEAYVSKFTAAEPITHLLDATRRCASANLNLHVELVPPGHSDGVCWTIMAHCPDCKCTRWVDHFCEGCGRQGSFIPARKQKVLGLRPYLLLESVLGADQTELFVNRFHDQLNRRS